MTDEKRPVTLTVRVQIEGTMPAEQVAKLLETGMAELSREFVDEVTDDDKDIKQVYCKVSIHEGVSSVSPDWVYKNLGPEIKEA